jgi:ATP phosphoribosyltransferase regulatory subunit
MKSKNLSENILKSLKSSGFDYIDLDTVIPTNLILERSGESFRSLIFSFVDQNGKEICLRPDLTVASCIKYLNQKNKKSSKVFYSGQAFRKVQKKTDKIIRDQIGFEILGSKDEKRDDKKIINTSIKVINKFRYKTGSITVGNVEIFHLLINKLDIPKRWRLRLQRHFWRENYFNELLKRLETNSDVDETVVELDKKRYLKMFKQNQDRNIAGRTLNEILLRFDNKIKDPRRQIKGQNVVKIIRDYLKISCPMSKAAATLNTFFKQNKINLSVGKNYFPITKNKVSKLNVNFSSSFGRHLEYYTGMVFKIQTKVKSRKIEVNGGRYDNLISDLGSKIKVPAVGGAINLND